MTSVRAIQMQKDIHTLYSKIIWWDNIITVKWTRSISIVCLNNPEFILAVNSLHTNSKINWVGKRKQEGIVRQGLVFSPDLITLWIGAISRELETLTGFIISRHKHINIRYADDTMLLIDKAKSLHGLQDKASKQKREEKTNHQM